MVTVAAGFGADVVVEVEEVVGVVAVLQRSQPRQLVGPVGAPDARLPLVPEGIDVYAAGERLDRAGVAAGGRHSGLVLRRITPTCHGHELHQRIAMTEGGLGAAHLGNRATVALQTARWQQRRMLAAAARQEGV